MPLYSRRELIKSLSAMGVGTQIVPLSSIYAEAVRSSAVPGRTAVTNTSQSPHVKLRALDMTDVRWTSGFWHDRFHLAHTTMVKSMWEMINNPENGASFVTFRMAAGAAKIVTYATPYSDGDCYKWLEGAAHVYAQTKDPEVKALMDEAVSVIQKAQAPDGYISTTVQVRGIKRWSDLRNLELYNMGHLMTAACVHQRATGEDSLLQVARRAADYLYTLFSPRPVELAHFSSNPSQIMGLVELYRTTREPRYLELAKIFVDMPGSQPGGTDDRQDRIPIRESRVAVGHAVIGTYLFAGATDLVAEVDDPALRTALDALWQDVATRKMYLTGGIGTLHFGFSTKIGSEGTRVRVDPVNEAFGTPYELPSRTAYNETCANIANAIWNWRMLTLTGDAKYAEVMERVFYNSLLSGVSLQGTEYFYSNPLRRDLSVPLERNDTPVRWPNTALRRAPNAKFAPACCCPSNALRTIASMHEYAYSVSDDALWVHLYGANQLSTKLPDGRSVNLVQDTHYPWDGRVKFTVKAAAASPYALHLRIPSWAEGAVVRVNGEELAQKGKALSYLPIRRKWKSGDVVELDLPTAVRVMTGSPKIDDTRGQVAIMRGPMVYCLEQVDLPKGISLDEICIPRNASFEAKDEPHLLGGVVALHGAARRVKPAAAEADLYAPATELAEESVPIRMIPYFSWANRGANSMAVWLPLA